jgi:excisionase family DNA binding protein
LYSKLRRRKDKAMGIEELKNKAFLARYLGVSMGTVNRWVHEGRGPRYVKVGNLVRYRMEDVREFLDRCPSGGGFPPRRLCPRGSDSGFDAEDARKAGLRSMR